MRKVLAKKNPSKIRQPRVYPLDQQIQQLKVNDPINWGITPVFWAVFSVIAGLFIAIVLLVLYSLIFNEDTPKQNISMTLSAVATVFMAIIASKSVEKIAERNDGWKTFGLRKLTLKQVGLALITWVGFIVVNATLSTIFDALKPGASDEGSNVPDFTKSMPIFVISFITIALIAPIVEEFVFRGVILHTLLCKYSFWPSAIITSLIFALFHVMQVSTLTGSFVLGATLFVLAILLAYLCRITGSIVPGMIVHGLSNGIAIISAFYL
ncbi:MAG: type II CAAX endopeptidase family protein [Micrococcaceae bacterium]